MKNLPKDMSEIESSKKTGEEKKTEESKDGKAQEEASGDEEEKKDKKKKKKKEEEEEEQPPEEEAIKLDSEEIGKLYTYTLLLYDEYLVTTTDILNDYNWFCNSDIILFRFYYQDTNPDLEIAIGKIAALAAELKG